jgi:hypothetical protein
LNGCRVGLGLLLLAAAGKAGAQAPPPVPQGPLVYVVAPSESTKREAQRVMRFCRWTDTTALRDADMVLVMVRSSGSSPMAPFYDSLKWLVDEAASQLNESGPQFHAYLFSIRKNLSLDQANHRSYDVDAGSNGELQRPRIRFGFACSSY